MGFYFTMYYLAQEQQEAGDTAFEQNNYQQALEHYTAALAELHQIAENPEFIGNRSYYDELTYTHSQIVKCHSQILRVYIPGFLAEHPGESFDYGMVKASWKTIRSALDELVAAHTVLCGMFRGATRSAFERMAEVYLSISQTAEAVSDQIGDFLDGLETWDKKHNSYMNAFLWLKRAKKHLINANQMLDSQKPLDKIKQEVPIALHFGCLNLMERAFDCNKDAEILARMTAYITKNGLHKLELSINDELELLSYELKIAVENNDELAINNLREYFDNLRNTMVDLDEQLELINQILQLFDRASSVDKRAEQETGIGQVSVFSVVSKKRSHEVDEAEASPATKKAKTEESVSELNPAPSTNIAPIELDASVTITAENMTLSAEIHVDVRPWQQPVATPSHVASILPFFAPPATTSAVVASANKNCQQTFEQTIKELVQFNNTPSFLAGLLTVIADYYSQVKNLSSNSTSVNAMLVAFALYETALMIKPDPTEVLAKKIEDLKKQPKGRDVYKLALFNKKSLPALQFNIPQYIFNRGMNNYSELVKDYVVENKNPEQLEAMYDHLLQYIGEEMTAKNLAGDQSEVFSSMIFAKRQNALLTNELDELKNRSAMSLS